MGKEPFVRDNFAKGFILSWYPLTRIYGIDISVSIKRIDTRTGRMFDEST